MIGLELDLGRGFIIALSIGLLVAAVVWAVWWFKWFKSVMPYLRHIIRDIAKHLKR